MPVIFSGGSFQARPVKVRWPRVYSPTGKAQPLPNRDSLSLNTDTPSGSLGKFKLFRFSSSRYGTRQLPPTPTYKHKYPLNPDRIAPPDPCEVCGLAGENGRCLRHRPDPRPTPKVVLSMKANDKAGLPCATPPYRGAP